MNKTETIVDKINHLLNLNEEIEYVTLEKVEELNIIALTNKRLIYSNKKLLKKNIFYFCNIENNTVEKINSLKKKLQLDKSMEDIITTYFNDINEQNQ
jgi:DNA-binding response OmpR family regulator